MIGRLDVVDHEGAAPLSIRGRRRWRTGGLCIGWLMVATWLQLIRGTGHHAYDVLWAEDGGVFLNQAMRHSLWENLAAPHAGYLQVVARLIAQPAGSLPIEWAAGWMAASSAVVVALISVLVWFCSGRVLTNLWARAVLAALVPLLPQMGFEVGGSISNLHWYLAYAAFWVLLAAPRTVRGQVGAAAVVVLAALSDPLTALVLPIAVVGLLRAPNRRLALIAPAAMIVALAVQGWVHLTMTVSFRPSPTVVGDLPKIYALRVVMSAVVGDRALAWLYVPLGLTIVAVIGVLVLAGLAALLRIADGPARLVAVLSLLISVIYLVAGFGLRGTEGVLDRASFGLNGSRYTIVPLLLLWTAVIVLLDQLATRSEAKRGSPKAGTLALIGIVTAAFLAVQLLNDWGLGTVRSAGPSWSAGLHAAEATCRKPPAQRDPQPAPLVAERQGKGSAPLVPGPDDVTVAVAPVLPAGATLLFAVVVPCSSLRN